MDKNNFIKQTICDLNEEWIICIKELVIDKFIFFNYVSNNEITPNILAEKIYDYFEKVEIKTGKSFDKLLSIYMDNLDKMVKGKIAETPKPKKGKQNVITTPRARKYYEKALSYKAQVPKVRSLSDYTRLMMCLYTAIIKNNYETITNFNYSATCLDLKNIMNSMETEPSSGILHRKKHRFNISNIYETDAATFILLVVILANIKHEEIKEDY